MRPSTLIAKAATRATWPLTRLDRNGDPSGPVVLCYHRVLPCPPSSPPPAYAVTPEQFRDQMSLLAREGFTSLTLEEFYEAARSDRELPRRSALITFDDGFADNYLIAWPIAREFGIKLNLFLCTSLIAGEQVEAFNRPSAADRANRKEFPHLWQPLTWAQVREMSTAEVGVGFHSHTHRNLGKLSAAEITDDAAKGLALFAEELGDPPECFAFPYGHYGSYSVEAISALKERGLEMFFTTELGRTPPHSANPISRIVVHPEDDVQSFRRKLYGGYDWMGRVRQFYYRMLDLETFWAIADQGIVSLGNFLTTIILARTLVPEAYGVWTVLFGLILLLNVVHASLIVYPLTIMAATVDPSESRSGTGGALVLTTALSLPLGLMLVGASWVIGAGKVGLWAAIALLGWQLQETTRRSLMAKYSCRDALPGDALSYLSQAALVWWLSHQQGLSLASAFAVIAGTCGVAGLAQARQLGLGIGSFNPRNLATRFWRQGHWVLWSELTSNVGFMATPWVLFLLKGAGTAAGYQAISNLVGLSHPVMLSLGNVIVPSAARARIKGGFKAARHSALIHAAQGGLVLLVCFGLLLAFPTQLLRLFYGSGSPYLSLAGDVRLFAVVYLLFFIGLTLKSLLKALQQTKAQFVAELLSCALLAVIIVPLVSVLGLTGALVALGIWLAARWACNLAILRKVKQRAP